MKINLFLRSKRKSNICDLGELNYLSEKSINKALKQESSEDFNTFVSRSLLQIKLI